MSKRQCSCGCNDLKLRLTETRVINPNLRRCRNCGHFVSEHVTLEDGKNDSRIVAEKSEGNSKDVLVVGPPQLTVNMVERVCAFHEWALDLSLPENVKELFKESMIDAWRSSKPEYAQGFELIMKGLQDIKDLEQGARDSLQKKYEQQLVERLKTYTDPVNVALLQLYESEKAPITPGDPQLTEEIADASLELINYQCCMVEGWPVSPITKEHKAVWRQMLGSQWSNLTADWKNYYSGAPLMWARIQSMSLEEKAAYNQNFKANLPYGYKEDFLYKIMKEVWASAQALG
jgi:hypothetical protein